MNIEINNWQLTLILLGIAFVILRLCNVITWSWWLVTLPFWGGLALCGVLFIILAFLVGVKILLILLKM